MKIIKPYARMIPSAVIYAEKERLGEFHKVDGVRLLTHIEWCARISHRTEDAVTEDSWRKIIENVVMKHGDWSVVEHAVVSVDMVVDRGITHEWVRHRLNAFTQESTRFVNYEKKMPPAFIYPIVGVECQYCLAGFKAEDKEIFPPDYNEDKPYGNYLVHEGKGMKCICPYNVCWWRAIDEAEIQYKELLKHKWRPQEARSVFPNALASRIVTTSNLRNWRHMFIMRTSQEAHPQMRQVMIPLLKEFQEKIPLLFDDIVPEMKQSEAMKRMR